MISKIESPVDIRGLVRPNPKPIMLGTWSFAAPAIAAAWKHIHVVKDGALNAVEEACRFAEADPHNQTVGTGGLPDRDGHVSLDAAIMLSPAKRGAVCAMQSFPHPISIARRVMEVTPHTLLAGAGAEKFADVQGFDRAELLTSAARLRWQAWRATQTSGGSHDALIPNFEEHPVAHMDERNALHDTIGVLALDVAGTIAAGCTTSGLPWKLPGRVGDSSVVGHGIYCDPRYGACVCTGHGELVSSVCGSFLAVEALRQGASPQNAAKEVVHRIAASHLLTERDQVGVIVLDRHGKFGSASLRAGFKIAMQSADRSSLLDPDFTMQPEAT